MAPKVLEAFGILHPIEINACAPCNLFWFDKSESVRLTPKAVLELFQYIGRSRGARTALASSFNCPRCTVVLAPTQDLQRTTRFTYWRCRNDHGQLITFPRRIREIARHGTPDRLLAMRGTGGPCNG